MDSKMHHPPGLDLPSPSGHQGRSIPADSTLPVIADPPVQAPAVEAHAAQPDVATATPAQVPTDDVSDALDQEWVHKAKTIVEQTKADPYLESKELSKVKADYLKIRYNKTIKVVEDTLQ